MAKNQCDFFKEKKPWSEVKDALLACYLKPYFQKILSTRRPVRYIDCFAGPGGFDDGKPGSPLIALDVARGCLKRSNSGNTDLRLIFNEALWAEDLKTKTAIHERMRRPQIGYEITAGRFDQKIPPLVTGMAGANVFLYIDPYGISDLTHNLLTGFAPKDSKDLYSIELLINFNSFGFIRAGCRAMKTNKFKHDETLRTDDEEFVDSIETNVDNSSRSIERLNAIAGGDYWIPIIEEYKKGKTTGRDTERRFSEAYRAKLGETYRFVLSMPIRLANRQQPKYRMIHVTNHAEGCNLMAENMMKRTENLFIHLKGHQQPTLLDEDIEGEATDPIQVKNQMETVIKQYHNWTKAQEIMAQFYASEGVICKTRIIHAVWKQMEEANTIQVDRGNTKNSHSTSFTTKGGKRVSIRYLKS